MRDFFRYVDVPGYTGLILRRLHADLVLPEAIYDRAKQWLAPWTRTGEVHLSHEEHKFTFPNGARLVFGHMQHESDRSRYDGSEYQYIAYDEVQQFTKLMYLHMFSRLRAKAGVNVPLRMRCAGMPDASAVGYGWLKERFVDPGTAGVVWIKALRIENPGRDPRYEESLAKLPEAKRLQLGEGRWDIVDSGGKFQREWFQIVEPSDIPAGARYVRAWDRAARPKVEGKPDPDYTAGVLMAVYDGRFWIVNVSRGQLTPQKGEEMIRQCAINDGRACPIEFAQERGSAGLHIVEHMQRNVLPGWRVEGHTESGDIETRADPLSSAAELGLVRLVRGHWVPDFLDEACSFPHGAHDDQIAAASLAHWYLTGGPQISTNIMTGSQAGLPTRRLTPSLGQTSGLGRSLGKHF